MKKLDWMMLVSAALAAFPFGSAPARGDGGSPPNLPPVVVVPAPAGAAGARHTDPSAPPFSLCMRDRTLHLLPYWVDDQGHLHEDLSYTLALAAAVQDHDQAHPTAPNASASANSNPAPAPATPPPPSSTTPSSGSFVSASAVPPSARPAPAPAGVTATTAPSAPVPAPSVAAANGGNGSGPLSANTPSANSVTPPSNGPRPAGSPSPSDAGNNHGLPRPHRLGYFEPVPPAPDTHTPIHPGNVSPDEHGNWTLHF